MNYSIIDFINTGINADGYRMLKKCFRSVFHKVVNSKTSLHKNLLCEDLYHEFLISKIFVSDTKNLKTRISKLKLGEEDAARYIIKSIRFFIIDQLRLKRINLISLQSTVYGEATLEEFISSSNAQVSRKNEIQESCKNLYHFLSKSECNLLIQMIHKDENKNNHTLHKISKNTLYKRIQRLKQTMRNFIVKHELLDFEMKDVLRQFVRYEHSLNKSVAA